MGLMFGVGRCLVFCAVILLVPAITIAQFPIAASGTEGLEVVVSSSEPVVATYQGNSASYSNDLYLMLDESGNPGDDGNPANDQFIFNNHTSPVGSTVELGTFPVGTRLIFRLHVNNTGIDYYTGQASRNPDNRAHARAQADWMPEETLVSFEDLLNGPFNYNDLSFSFVPTTAQGCADAYFVGLHGSIEGPDGSDLPDSPTIVETLNTFDELAREKGKVIDVELLLYTAPDWHSWVDIIHEALPYEAAGREELHRHIQTVLRRCPTQGFVLVGYSFGAWIINDWLSRNSHLWQHILAVELYGDPLWYRVYDVGPLGAKLFYGGLARRAGQEVSIDLYKEDLSLSDRWQSRCLHGDPICGEEIGRAHV
jgi:hypothetical protein